MNSSINKYKYQNKLFQKMFIVKEQKSKLFQGKLDVRNVALSNDPQWQMVYGCTSNYIIITTLRAVKKQNKPLSAIE